jgi:hypothetical protein
VLLEFVRALVRNTWSGDVLALALMQTQTNTKASVEEMRHLIAAVRAEHDKARIPAGFMPPLDLEGMIDAQEKDTLVRGSR